MSQSRYRRAAALCAAAGLASLAVYAGRKYLFRRIPRVVSVPEAKTPQRGRVAKLIRSNPVVLFSKSTCPYCKRAKKLLRELGAAFRVVEVDLDPDGEAIAAELRGRTGRATLPNIFIGGRGIGGCNDGPGLIPLHERGELISKLVEAGALGMASLGAASVTAGIDAIRREMQELKGQIAGLTSGSRGFASAPTESKSKGGWRGGGAGVVARDTCVVMISGDKSQVGKSSCCLGLLGSLLRSGAAKASEIAYIKPATQCEKPTLISKFCRTHGIEAAPIGPIVFYAGFTRSFLKGATKTSAQMLDEVADAVAALARGKKFVVVDGVGYPAVGSICGVSNAHVARRLGAPVLLIGKRGVGDAVDSTNLNSAFFASHGVSVLGSIFNRIKPDNSYYSLKRCKEAVTAYFRQFNAAHRVYGFIPELDALIKASLDAPAKASSARGADARSSLGGVAGGGSTGASGGNGASSSAASAAPARAPKASDDVRLTPADEKLADAFISTFMQYVDYAALIRDVQGHNERRLRGGAPDGPSEQSAGNLPAVATKKQPSSGSGAPPRIVTRKEIEAEAKKAGGKAG